jgi:2-keto-4-pentenoate hydratase/2-oxohepta-3-ene-1,7-dioic acid hydratase in catechol pathway
VDDPEKILCVGKNYAAHAAEVPELFRISGGAPEIFAKFRNTLVPHNGQVRLNPRSQKHDYEAEIAVVMGRRAAGVSPEEAMDHVFGYTLANDISARDLQKAASQWTPGKTCDTFCPLGPCILTAEEAAWDKIRLTGYKNGQLRQSGCSGEMIYSIPYIVSFLSGCCTLEPGDVILTGTPAGVIFGRPEGEQDWLQAGDELLVSAEGIGTLRVTVTN